MRKYHNIQNLLNPMKTLLCCLLACMMGTSLNAQLREVPLSDLQVISSAIVEGTVTARESFWNNSQTRIYTLYQVEVSDFLMGSGPTRIEVVELGGCVENHCQTIYPGLELGLGQRGVFFLRPFTKESLYSNELLTVVSGPLGFIEFHEKEGKEVGANALRIFDLNQEVYIPIAGRPKRSESAITIAANTRLVPTIDSFYPTVLAAGVDDTLTITGTCFGIDTGKVWFQNADKPTGIYMHGDNPDFVVWNDTLIRVLVPSDASIDSMRKGVAGSGPIQVENSVGNATSTVDPLTIEYAIRRRRVSIDRREKLVVLSAPTSDTLGLYRFRMDSAFAADTSAAAVFRKALRDWRCTTLVNWTVEEDSAGLSSQFDGVSSVSFEPLDPGILGQTAVNEEFCTDMATGELFYYTRELDMEFTESIPFHIDTISAPTPSEADLYSVMLHELGHGHLLQHRSLPGNMMDFEIALGATNRTIDPTIQFAGERVIDSSQVMRSLSCAAPMTQINPAICDVLNTRPAFHTPFAKIALFPNPASTEANLVVQLRKPTKEVEIRIFDQMGKPILIQSQNAGATKTVSFQIPTASLPSGIFPVMILTGEGIDHQLLTIIR